MYFQVTWLNENLYRSDILKELEKQRPDFFKSGCWVQTPGMKGNE